MHKQAKTAHTHTHTQLDLINFKEGVKICLITDLSSIYHFIVLGCVIVIYYYSYQQPTGIIQRTVYVWKIIHHLFIIMKLTSHIPTHTLLQTN